MSRKAILFKPGAGDPALWRAELAARLPDYELRTWPELGDPDEVEFVLLFKAEPGMFRGLGRLKGILATGAGVDGIFRDPELPAVPVARIVDDWMSMQMGQWCAHAVLHFARRMPEYAALQARGAWTELDVPTEGTRRVGILGCGEIGGFAARFLAPMGFEVAGWTRRPRDLGGFANFHGEEGLAPFLRRSEFLVVLLPLTPATRGLIDAARLALLPPGAVLINAARGALVATADLMAALDSGRLAGAFLDVTDPEPLPPDHPLWRYPNVRITPHVAGITNPRTAAAQVAENVRRLERGERPLNEVDRGQGY